MRTRVTADGFARVGWAMAMILVATAAAILSAVAVSEAIDAWVPVVRPDPVITIETPHGVATISGPGAEYVLHSAFPVYLGESL